jgi:lethal(2) giant larvae protein
MTSTPPLTKSLIFAILAAEDDEEAEDEWPPFRKVGHFDPFSDDPRLAVKKVAFCAKSGRLMIGGTAGQVLIRLIFGRKVSLGH